MGSSSSGVRGRRRSRGVLAALITGGLAAASLAIATPAVAAPSSVTLVGSLQSELGCAADWDPGCAATVLPSAGGTTYQQTFDVPAGSYLFKVAIDGSWTVNYGAGGVADGANLPLVLEGPVRLKFTYDDATHLVSFALQDVPSGPTAADAAFALDALRPPATRERFYFVMADRFANGDKANDTGGLTGDRLTTGFDPTDKAFYHGGDLAGITDKLNYIKGLGTTAIWLTPSFKNKPVQGGPGQESAGYHGYWITDFTQIDPHLGTNAEMKALIDAAHKKGMKVYFDIITNHTADVIDYTEGTYSYRNKERYPYTDASGAAFDDRDYIGKPFPLLDQATSFPYTPFFHSPADAQAKTPAWLNDPLMYHNRGDSTFAGESSTYGDFVGLDDLFTERPEVVEGMGDIYQAWVDFGIDGFRIDTVKHVNLEFWQGFIPGILNEAQRVGNDDFFAFGEVYDGNPAVMSQYTTAGKLQATLDFGFQQQGVDWASGTSSANLADFYAGDDWYTDADSNAYQLPTFLGNHDMGRGAMFLQRASANDTELMARVKLANSLMYVTRGNPVTYYGDEQGFIGTGGDQLAREDMFASQVDIYNNEQVLGGPSGSMDRYSRTSPLYQHIRELSRIRDRYPTLADGAQIPRYAADGAGLFAVSRYAPSDGHEFLVVANNATTAQSATLPTWTPKSNFTPVYGTMSAARSGADGSVSVTVPPLTVSVWRAAKDITVPKAAPTVSLTLPAAGATLHGRAEVSATVDQHTFLQATFMVRPAGTQDWTVLGTDDHAPFRVFDDVSGYALGTVLEYRTVVKNASGAYGAASTWGVVGTPPPPSIDDVENGDPPATQPSAVSVPGTHGSEMGCPITGGVAGDWDPACAQGQLTLDAQDQIWKATIPLGAGTYAYKAALDNSWTVNYGRGGVFNGENIDYENLGDAVSFYFDPTTHWATSNAQGAILTASGSFQSELGCAADWAADCMRPWLQDKDGDGTSTFSTVLIPAGTYEFKVAEGLSWTVNYGQNGVLDGANIPVTVPADGSTTTFSYNAATHVTTVVSVAP